MGRSSRLRKQRRERDECPRCADMGEQWVRVHGTAAMNVCCLPTDNYLLEWHSLDGFARVMVPSMQLGQVESLTMITLCDSEREVHEIRTLLAEGFATKGFPQIQLRFYCDESQRWVVPVSVSMRQFYR